MNEEDQKLLNETHTKITKAVEAIRATEEMICEIHDILYRVTEMCNRKVEPSSSAAGPYTITDEL